MKIRIVSPASVTGGPELLHQLCHTLRASGFDAAMSYSPFGDEHETPAPFLNYNAPQAPFEDSENVLVVIPESRTGLIEYIRCARVAIWWLSFDNYIQRKPFTKEDNPQTLSINQGTRRRISLSSLREKDLVHLSQSQYATNQLALSGIPSLPLGDYLNEMFTESIPSPEKSRENAIAYNPKKGIRRIRKLIRRHPDITWIPLEKMSRKQIIETLRAVKLYVDFGHHPGRDRIPREAASCGACVVTGRDGSANNCIDIPIPGLYKLDTTPPKFLREFRRLAYDIFANFPEHSKAFDDYRKIIKSEKSEFERRVRTIFTHLREHHTAL